MAAPPSAYKDRQFIAVIGDEDSVTGLLLAGIGHITDPPDSQKNFLVCDSKTEKTQIEQAFNRFTKERKDIGIVLINQHVLRSKFETLSTDSKMHSLLFSKSQAKIILMTLRRTAYYGA
ncbi:V-type proton ATPase subunit F [Fonsecaea multimorphosa]|nr:V-type proton ATPase subunit F [Fonsecaea multimorphosa]